MLWALGLSIKSRGGFDYLCLGSVQKHTWDNDRNLQSHFKHTVTTCVHQPNAQWRTWHHTLDRIAQRLLCNSLVLAGWMMSTFRNKWSVCGLLIAEHNQNGLTSLRREAQQVCFIFHTTAATRSSDRKQLKEKKMRKKKTKQEFKGFVNLPLHEPGIKIEKKIIILMNQPHIKKKKDKNHKINNCKSTET